MVYAFGKCLMMSEFRVPTPKELQDLRKKVGLTQEELATRVGISQSLVARIESGQVNPSIITLKRILNIIEDQQQVSPNLRELLKWKGQTTKMQQLIGVSPDDTVRRAVILMRRHGISQLPVIKKNKSVGCIGESTILRKLMVMDSQKVFSLSVHEIMEEAFPSIDINEDVELAFSKIATGVEALLIEDQGRPVGIVTKIDIIAFTRI